MRKYGLPTYPIFDGMDVGYERDDKELDWLLEHGYFINTPIGPYRKIIFLNGDYILLSGSHERHLVGREEVLDHKGTLDRLLKSKHIGAQRLGRWQWYGKDEIAKP